MSDTTATYNVSLVKQSFNPKGKTYTCKSAMLKKILKHVLTRGSV